MQKGSSTDYNSEATEKTYLLESEDTDIEKKDYHISSKDEKQGNDFFFFFFFCIFHNKLNLTFNFG